MAPQVLGIPTTEQDSVTVRRNELPMLQQRRNLKVVMLSERSQETQSASCVAPFLEHSRKCQLTYSDEAALCLPGDAGCWEVPQGAREKFWRVVDVFAILTVVMVLWVHACVCSVA